MSEPNEPGQNDHGKNNEREVTDPITHLPLTIHDADAVELQRIPPPLTASEEKKHREKDGGETKQATNARHAGMEDMVRETLHGKWWEDPIGDQRKTRIQTSVVAAGAATVGTLGALVLWSFFSAVLGNGGKAGLGWVGIFLAPFACCLLGLGVGAAGLSLGVYQHSQPLPQAHSPSINQDRQQHDKSLNKDESEPESAEWLNSLLNSVWPIVNPALFTSVADMLEDAMQATLPKLVRRVRVADIGQGSDSVRILGVRQLDAGSAMRDVDGMKAEEGDFVNMELALAYRAKETTVKGIRERSANAHMLMEFWTSGGIMIPVWVDLTGFLATIRVRIQLTPNPPFLSVMTVALLGLPAVTLKCTPLAKGFLNVMDVPGLSGWLQKSINMAVEEYVAPRSLTLDLKTLLMGREKMDTDAVGVVILTVRYAEGYKSGDAGKIFKSSEGKKGDAYVTVGWGKWGKPLWSTRIISSAKPIWEETTALLVGPAELNAQESLQLQLWDSDRFTADDLLGNIQVGLNDLMTSKESLNNVSIRSDAFVDDNGNKLPGTLHWECGYFAKTTFEQHLAHKHHDADKIRASIEQKAESKLREARARGGQSEDDEVRQQKKEDVKEKSDEIVAGSRPTAEWPSGILSVKIEQISGLEVEKIRESGVEDDDEVDGDLPSAYCTVIIDQQRVYKTRTKMKSNNPFYDAGTEKFIRDWTTADVIISVRDSRMHEADPVIGIVVLPLREVFKHNSQFTESLPLVGGIGYGRMRLSLTFRSVQLKLPKRLRGWDLGTLEISPHVQPSSDLSPEYASCRLVFRTLYGKAKMIPSTHDGGWAPKRAKHVRLPVKKRYASCLLIELRKHAVGADPTPAFCTLWLKDIQDEEEVTLSLSVRKNVDTALAHARANASSDIGEHVGTLKLNVRFWPGLSGYHKFMADHDKNMAEVMEVLDYAEGQRDASEQLLEDQDYSSSSDSSSDEEDEGSEGNPPGGPSTKSDGLAKDLGDGVVGQFKDFRKRKGELHRKHRGLMQWKAMRNVAWIGRGVENQAGNLGDKVKGAFKHHDRKIAIEKEV
ncbi:hypothetical protein GALMADRAFT_244535 [Galerina marginata CBS 339.88]|uniref:Uncharacterized protein n=1 Tax=Galerina marginata (strain CBS 339.88) TaxID=685588 RepID=A0A067T6T4_GALM3|nr:hypothetical protein GALMADRAFT_244535 [Galerina marginata CBS 339.88]